MTYLVPLIFFVGGSLLLILTIYFNTIKQRKASREILSKLKDIDFEIVKIKYREYTAAGENIQIRAIMYFSEDIIVITPEEKGYWNGMVSRLPIILIRNGRYPDIGKWKPVFKYVLSLTSWNSISISCGRPSLVSRSYFYKINLVHKAEFSKIEKIKEWVNGKNNF